MKVTCKVMTVVALCAGLTHVVLAEKIKIAKQDPLFYKELAPYFLETVKGSGKEQSALKKLKNNATISFDPNDRKVTLVVNAHGAERRIILKYDPYKFYQNKGILLYNDGTLAWADKNEAPFMPTHKIAVQKQNSDGKEWTIRADAEAATQVEGTYGQESTSYAEGSKIISVEPVTRKGIPFVFVYGEVKIKNSTNIGKGLTVPMNKAFDIRVLKGKGQNWVTTPFSAEQAKNMKKIIIDKEGKATSA